MSAKSFLCWCLVSALLALLGGCGGGGKTVVPRPLITGITPGDFAGAPNAAVTFSAETSAPVFSYSWDFGGGARPNVSTDPTPEVRLWKAGAYAGSLTVLKDDGESETLAFSYTISNPAPAWAAGVLPESVELLRGFQLTGKVSGTTPILVDDDNNGGSSKGWYRPDILSPLAREDWQSIAPDAALESGRSVRSIASLDEQLAVLTQKTISFSIDGIVTNDYRLFFATDGSTVTSTEWQDVQPAWAAAGAGRILMRNIDGRLAVIFEDPTFPKAEFDRYYFTVATRELPTSPDDWTTPVRAKFPGEFPLEMAAHEGRLAMLGTIADVRYPGNLNYAEAPTLYPTEFSDAAWGSDLTLQRVLDNAYVRDNGHGTLFFPGGHPLVAISRSGKSWMRSAVKHPTSQADWQPIGFEGPIAMDGDRIMTAGVNQDGLFIRRALTDNPLSEADFTPRIWLDLMENVPPFFEDELLLLPANGRIYIVYPFDYAPDPQDQYFHTRYKLLFTDTPWPD